MTSPQSQLPTQTSFLPTLCNRTKPPPPSADADFIAICDQTAERYLCKSQAKYPYLPATEWICSSLALECGLPVPPFVVIEMESEPRRYLFGSQWLGGSLDWAFALPSVSNPHVFSETFTVDAFSHNVDRHLNNYLYLQIAGDIVLRPIDFSRSLLQWGMPLPPLPLDSSCNTIAARKSWQAAHPLHSGNSIQARLAAIPNDWMLRVVDSMPAPWLDPVMREKLLAWWVSPDRQARVVDAQSHL
jgi:hypothetical protein